MLNQPLAFEPLFGEVGAVETPVMTAGPAVGEVASSVGTRDAGEALPGGSAEDAGTVVSVPVPAAVVVSFALASFAALSALAALIASVSRAATTVLSCLDLFFSSLARRFSSAFWAFSDSLRLRSSAFSCSVRG